MCMPEHKNAELVPMAYHHQALAEIGGLSLRYHTDRLSSEDAERLNEQIDFSVGFGTHGRAQKPEDFEHLSPKKIESWDWPTQREYTEAAEFVEDMEPGDVLCVEGHNFNGLYGDSDGSLTRLVQQYIDRGTPEEVARSEVRRRLDRARDDYKLTAFDYAVGRAELKGVRVEHADLDALQTEALMTVMSKDTERSYSDQREEWFRLRALAARNIAKDIGLEVLDASKQDGVSRKPKVKLLFGRLEQHKDDVIEACDAVGLRPGVVDMHESSKKERLAEHVEWLLRKASEVAA